jgi:hypothetical protein
MRSLCLDRTWFCCCRSLKGHGAWTRFVSEVCALQVVWGCLGWALRDDWAERTATQGDGCCTDGLTYAGCVPPKTSDEGRLLVLQEAECASWCRLLRAQATDGRISVEGADILRDLAACLGESGAQPNADRAVALVQGGGKDINVSSYNAAIAACVRQDKLDQVRV